VLNGSQQQFIVRNSELAGWSNAVWNQVFMGDTGTVPPQSFGSVAAQAGGPPSITTLATSLVTREAPYLTIDGSGRFSVFVPDLQFNPAGPTWTAGPTAGASIPISRFFVARPSDPEARINAALGRDMDLLLTPRIYHLNGALRVKRVDTMASPR
jgi:hypothetical protein